MPLDNPYRTPFGDLGLLADAQDRISTRNTWVQGRFKDGNRRCLVAALSVASGSSSFELPNQTERRLARLLAAHIPRTAPFWARIRLVPARQRLMWFNDSPRTGHEDVMALFDRTFCHLANTAPVHA
jgi:hypothetical protein